MSDTAVCEGHSTPLDFLETCCHVRPDVSLLLGPRGGGKSYLSSFATFYDSLCHPKHGTRILGGSLSQSEQIYHALRDFEEVYPPAFASITKTRATFANGSDVAILPASPTSVRGPHVPTLRLDEIDEIEPDIRDSSYGMCMAKEGVRASVSMCSTWHRLGGPMEELLERGRSGEFPTFTFCVFEVLERCPDERSGAHLEKCRDCPLVQWCHDVPKGVAPKAKRANGHYAIDSLIQKVRAVSRRIFEADYLCSGPKADGVWFPGFDIKRHVSLSAEYARGGQVFLAVDPGVHTGAVLFQVWQLDGITYVTVFADYLSEGISAENNARAILRLVETYCDGRVNGAFSDPAGGARNPIGPTVLDEYARCGLVLYPWDTHNPSVSDGLELVEGLLNPADGVPKLKVHPRCTQLIRAFQAYRRASVKGQWRDWPEDPQHPHEDLMDALRGGLHARLRKAVDRLFL